MRDFHVTRRTPQEAGISPVDTRRRPAWPAALPGQCSKVIDEDCRVYEGDELKIVHLCTPPSQRFLDAVRSVKFGGGYRTSGLKARSRVFGFNPRNELRRDYCSACSFTKENPAANAELVYRGQQANALFSTYNQARFDLQTEMIAQVRPEWRIPNTVFTSGIINENSALHYHYDSGNFSGAWSAMYVFINDMKGGELNVPEYDIAIRFRTGSLLLFDGQGLLHGVTPLTPMSDKAYRYSVVYYALSRMRNCLCEKDELARIRKVKTLRELKRGGM